AGIGLTATRLPPDIPPRRPLVTAPRPAADVQTPTTDAGGSLRRRWPLLVLGLIVLAIAAAWLGISYLVLGDEPAPVGVAGATASPYSGATSSLAAEAAVQCRALS